MLSPAEKYHHDGDVVSGASRQSSVDELVADGRGGTIIEVLRA